MGKRDFTIFEFKMDTLYYTEFKTDTLYYTAPLGVCQMALLQAAPDGWRQRQIAVAIKVSGDDSVCIRWRQRTHFNEHTLIPALHVEKVDLRIMIELTSPNDW